MGFSCGQILLFCVGAALSSQLVDAGMFSGQSTYYGDNGWAGSCMGNVRWAGGRYNEAAWPPSGGQFGTRVALNSAQYSTDMCGKKLMFRGTGTGLGYSPVSTSWQPAMVTNLCPECAYGDLDIGAGGDGRWEIEWYWVGDDSSGLSTESQSAARAFTKRSSMIQPKRSSRKSQPTKSSSKSSSRWKNAWKQAKASNTRESKARVKRMIKKYWAKKRAHNGRRLLLATP